MKCIGFSASFPPLQVLIVMSALALSPAARAQSAGQAAGPGADGGPPYELYGPGLLARPAFQAADQKGRYRIEIWGLLIGPGKKTDTTTLPGDSILMVRSGRGMVSIDGKNQELTLGGAYQVRQNHQFQIENFDRDSPISIRAVIIREN
jgi:mannose-6-phosphate isomerase-like protein (cupin superfamily)